MYKGVQVFLFDPKSLNNCVNLLFRAGSASWCWITIIIYCYELVTTKNIIHSFTICIPCRIQHNAMLPRPLGGDYEFKLAFEMIPRWEGGGNNQNIFWCELPTGTWHWHQDDKMKTGNWCGETGGSSNGVTDNTQSSYTQCFHLLGNLQQCFVKIILLCLWCWKLEPKVSIWENCAGPHILEFAEINYISDSSHPYLSTGQLGGNSYDNWKLRSDFNLRRWKNASSLQDWNVKLE